MYSSCGPCDMNPLIAAEMHFKIVKISKMDTDWHLSHFAPPPPTIELFLVSYERYGQINTFLLQYYGTDFASIKRYD